MVDECCGGTGGGAGCGCRTGRPPGDDAEGCGCGPAIEDGGTVVDAPTEADELEPPIGAPPAPSGPEWEAWADRVLADVDYDTELGKDLARDALRLADDGLSEAEFHRRHTDAVLEEFGVDDRPTKPTVEDSAAAMPRVPTTHPASETTRRNLLHLFGGAVVAGTSVSLAGCVVSGQTATGNETNETDGNTTSDDDTQVDGPPRQVQLGMVVDTDACIGCLQCSLACKEENNTSVGVHWPYVFRYEDTVGGETFEGKLTRHCQHCSRASCTFVCPTEARHKRTEDGIVLTDYDLCVGCKYCQVACPYGVNYLGTNNPTDLSDGFNYRKRDRRGRTVAGPPPKGVMGKCTYCVHRQDSDDPELVGTTACEQRCPANVIHFGDMNDPESAPRKYLRGEFPGRDDVPEKNRFKLLEQVGNKPNVVFLGNEPSAEAKPIEGPVAYRDHGMDGGAYEFERGERHDGAQGGGEH